MFGRFFRIELALCEIACVESVGRRDRMIVTQSTMAEQDLVDHFLTLDRQFQCRAQIAIAERLSIETHRESVMQRTRDLEDFNIGIARQ